MHQLSYYGSLFEGTCRNMKVRKAEFTTEIILSLLIVSVVFKTGVGAELAVPSIAVIHSLNVARAMEAYQQAQIDLNDKQK